MHSPAAFYDAFAPYYDLIFEDWDKSMARQAAALDAIIRTHRPQGAISVLDVACGIGTQALGLAALGYKVTASDLAPAALRRAEVEASRRRLPIDFSVADMRAAHEHHRKSFDVVLCADNSLPHLLTDDDIVRALVQFYQCTSPGGLCIVTVRDYANEVREPLSFKPYGVRDRGGKRYSLFQVWSWEERHYDLHFCVVGHDPQEGWQHCMATTRYYAISIDELMQLMRSAGFENVQRIDQRLYQPVLLGARSP
jgi:SAM-dependent methyltransferase